MLWVQIWGTNEVNYITAEKGQIKEKLVGWCEKGEQGKFRI